MNAKTLFILAQKYMDKNEISTSVNDSDLLLKVTPISTTLIEQYDFRNNISTFKDNIDHQQWYDIPFGNYEWYEYRGMSCGEYKPHILLYIYGIEWGKDDKRVKLPKILYYFYPTDDFKPNMDKILNDTSDWLLCLTGHCPDGFLVDAIEPNR